MDRTGYKWNATSNTNLPETHGQARTGPEAISNINLPETHGQAQTGPEAISSINLPETHGQARTGLEAVSNMKLPETQGQVRTGVDMSVKGFTLIEVMFALTILSIGILSISVMFITGAKGITGSHRSYMAVQASRAQMELLRGSDVSGVFNADCSTPSTATIQCIWSVRKNVPVDGLSTLEVIASWSEGDNKRQLVLTSLRFDGD